MMKPLLGPNLSRFFQTNDNHQKTAYWKWDEKRNGHGGDAHKWAVLDIQIEDGILSMRAHQHNMGMNLEHLTSLGLEATHGISFHPNYSDYTITYHLGDPDFIPEFRQTIVDIIEYIIKKLKRFYPSIAIKKSKYLKP